jgi:hypothetical protein
MERLRKLLTRKKKTQEQVWANMIKLDAEREAARRAQIPELIDELEGLVYTKKPILYYSKNSNYDYQFRNKFLRLYRKVKQVDPYLPTLQINLIPYLAVYRPGFLHYIVNYMNENVKDKISSSFIARGMEALTSKEMKRNERTVSNVSSQTANSRPESPESQPTVSNINLGQAIPYEGEDEMNNLSDFGQRALRGGTRSKRNRSTRRRRVGCKTRRNRRNRSQTRRR